MNQSRNDEFYMQQALEEAMKSLKNSEVPVGAVIVEDGVILGRSHNASISWNDPTAHAEIVVIREVCQKKGNYRLPDCELYVTLEPCVMCLGAVVQARMKRLIFGACDSKGGAVESIMNFPFEKMNHCPEIKGGILAEDCGKILLDFFQGKR